MCSRLILASSFVEALVHPHQVPRQHRKRRLEPGRVRLLLGHAPGLGNGGLEGLGREGPLLQLGEKVALLLVEAFAIRQLRADCGPPTHLNEDLRPLLSTQAERLARQDNINERLTAAIERLDATLEAIKDILRRGNGRP